MGRPFIAKFSERPGGPTLRPWAQGLKTRFRQSEREKRLLSRPYESCTVVREAFSKPRLGLQTDYSWVAAGAAARRVFPMRQTYNEHFSQGRGCRFL